MSKFQKGDVVFVEVLDNFHEAVVITINESFEDFIYLGVVFTHPNLKKRGLIWYTEQSLVPSFSVIGDTSDCSAI